MDKSETRPSENTNVSGIKLEQLRSFVLVAEEGNLTRAARRRHTTPSAVSEHLRQLESQLGLSLFERSARGMQLTRAGEALLVPAQKALGQVGNLLEMARSLGDNPLTAMEIGLNAPPEYLKVDQLIQQAARTLPQLSLELRTSASARIAGLVAEGSLDMGFVYGDWSADRRLVCHKLASIRVCVVGPPDGPDALPETMAQRARLPWIWPSATCPFIGLVPRVLGEGWKGANRVTTSEDEHTTVAMIRAGMGFGLVERAFAENWARQGAVRLYESPRLELPLSLCVHRDKADRERYRACIRLVGSLWQPAPVTETG